MRASSQAEQGVKLADGQTSFSQRWWTLKECLPPAEAQPLNLQHGETRCISTQTAKMLSCSNALEVSEHDSDVSKRTR
ncbi:hypothetical protein M3J09_007377 [Ascochyta lentis]